MTTTSVQLKAHPSTDYWRKPPSTDVSSAPLYTVQHVSQGFRNARATVSASWRRLYDQGGLLILLPTPPDEKRRWVKAGIEYAGGRPYLSVVGTREWSDWSLHALDGDTATIQIERKTAEAESPANPSLLVYLVADGKRADLPLREVTWAFEQEGEIEVGVYAARPTKLEDNDEEELTVNFEDIELDANLQIFMDHLSSTS